MITVEKIGGPKICPACAKVQAATKEFKNLKISNQEDRYQGEKKATAASEQLESFAKMSKKAGDRDQIFKNLLSLAREASVFEGEAQVTQSLAGILKDDPSLKKSFDAYVKGQPQTSKLEICKNQNFEKKTTEQLCLMNAGGTGQESGSQKDAKVQKCTQAFNFEVCLKGSKK